jgi:hypothetical protein
MVMMIDDDRVSVPVSELSAQDIGHAGLKDISQIRDYRIRQEGSRVIHTMNLGGGSYLSITYSDRGEVLAAEPKGVRFERLGESLFVMKDSE